MKIYNSETRDIMELTVKWQKVLEFFKWLQSAYLTARIKEKNL